MAESFAQLLKRDRIAAGLSQEQLAELAGVSTDAISALERGLHHAPYKATLDLLTAALALDDDARLAIEEAAKLARARGPRAQQNGALPDSPEETVPNNLPLQLTSFVDRENVVAEIEELLQSYRLVTVVGTGGVGKTRCAIQVARGMLDGSGDGVWLAELAPIHDPALVPAVIARTLGVQEAPNRPVLDTLLAYLKRKRLILILDNCEHVVDEARRVAAAILNGCPDVRTLATSRESLGIAGEHVYQLPPLSVPLISESLSVDEMLRYGAVQLFSDRALSADNRFALGVESAPHVADICRRLEGIPLAIELAAARVKVLSPEQLAQKLDVRFGVLTAGNRDALPRHRTMRALIGWSYDLLTDDERRLFRKLSIFAGDFTLELVTSICSDMEEVAVLDLLASLVDKSLVQTEPAASVRRYRLLESTREYAREKLRDAGEEYAAARDHARAFLALAEQLRDAWETTSDREWLARAEPELGNFRAALGWALEARSDLLLGQRLAAALDAVWGNFPTEGRRWVQPAQRCVDAETPPAVVAALDLAEAHLASVFAQWKGTLRAAQRALVRYRELADPRGVARAETQIGRAQLYLGEIQEGEALTVRALEAHRAHGARRSVVRSLQNLGWARLLTEDPSGARQRFGEALEMARAVGAQRAAATLALNLADAEFRGESAAEALTLIDEALAIFRAFGSSFGVALALGNMAAYLLALRRYDEARVAAREAVTAARDVQHSVAAAFALQHLAAIAASRPQAKGLALEDRRRAARVLGYVDARLAAFEALREFTELQEYDVVIAELRNALGERELAKLMAEGGAWHEDRAVAEAMLV